MDIRCFKTKAMVIKLTVSRTRPHPILVCDRPFLFRVKGQSGSRERRSASREVTSSMLSAVYNSSAVYMYGVKVVSYL